MAWQSSDCDHTVLDAKAFSEGKRKCAQSLNAAHASKDDFLFLFFLYCSSSLMAAYKSLTIRPLNEKEHKKEELSVPAEAAVCGQ
jgi:hypothetical protein